jgi:S-DNA-T family DNA segregation ATPase FtsK/SpoIIIE
LTERKENVSLSRGEPALPEPGQWSRVLFRGDDDRRRLIAHALLGRLAAAYSPDEMLIAVYASPERRAGWAWTRWLPHTRRPPERPGNDPDRVTVSSAEELTELLGPGFADRPAFDAAARPDPREPLVVVVIDGGDLPAGDRLTRADYRNTMVFDLSGTRRRPGRSTVRLDAGAHGVTAVWLDRDRIERSVSLDGARVAVLLAPDRAGETDGHVADRGIADLLDAAATGDSLEWPPPLTMALTIDHLLPPLVPDRDRGLTTADPPEGGFLSVPVGILDRPFERLADLLYVDMSGERGHAVVIGGAGSGKSTLVITLVAALALTHTPREAQFYCLDFSGALGPLSGLPHVGVVAGGSDPERVGSTIKKISALLEHRERLFRDREVDGMADYRHRRAAGEFADEPYGDVFLVVDGISALRREFGELVPILGRLAAHGIAHGIHLVVTATGVGELPGAVRDLAGTRLELWLDDPAGSMAGARAAAAVPRRPGRGLSTDDGTHYLIALPRVDGVEGTQNLAESVAALAAEVAEHWAGRPGAPRVNLLPAEVSAESLPAPAGELEVMLGLTDGRLGPVAHDFTVAPHLTVIGDAGSGKTNALRLIAQSIMDFHTPGEARFLLVDRSGELLHAIPDEFLLGNAFSPGLLDGLVHGTAGAIAERVPRPDIDPARLRSAGWWHGPRLFIMVDDYEQVLEMAPDPFKPLLEYLGTGYDIGLHLIVARSSTGAGTAMTEPLMRGLHDAGGATLLLSCPPSEASIAGVEPRVLPPGRAQYRAGGEIHLIQTAVADRRG